MIRASTISLLFLTILFRARASIDLTPSVTEYEAAGFKRQQLNFRHDQRRIEYEPPSGWTYQGDSRHLYLVPPQKKLASALIEATPLNKPGPPGEKTFKAIEERFVASLPPGSQFVKIEEELENAVLVDGNPSFQITVSYQAMGEKFLASAFFVNLSDTQLVFRLTARKDDFGPLCRAFKTSILAWHWLDEPQRTAKQAATMNGLTDAQ